ncbi:MAG: anti-sigma factor antagonist [Lachnospiraceae bacterium]
MKHRYEKEYGCLVLSMPEELDHHQAEALKEEADQLILKYSVRNLVFDFEHTNFMDSSGIGVIIGRCKNVKFSGGFVKAVHLNEQIHRIFKLSGLMKMIEVEE